MAFRPVILIHCLDHRSGRGLGLSGLPRGSGVTGEGKEKTLDMAKKRRNNPPCSR